MNEEMKMGVPLRNSETPCKIDYLSVHETAIDNNNDSVEHENVNEVPNVIRPQNHQTVLPINGIPVANGVPGSRQIEVWRNGKCLILDLPIGVKDDPYTGNFDPWPSETPDYRSRRRSS